MILLYSFLIEFFSSSFSLSFFLFHVKHLSTYRFPNSHTDTNTCFDVLRLDWLLCLRALKTICNKINWNIKLNENLWFAIEIRLNNRWYMQMQRFSISFHSFFSLLFLFKIWTLNNGHIFLLTVTILLTKGAKYIDDWIAAVSNTKAQFKCQTGISCIGHGKNPHVFT